MTYQLLDTFRGLFEGTKYRHRVSTHGDVVAIRLFEDLHALGRSKTLVDRIDKALSVLNTQNRRHGVKARRGDGTFGENVPQTEPIKDEGFAVCRGAIATIEIGIEVKILAKAMIKQIDRVINDLEKQAAHFKSKGGTPITVGIVGINHAEHYLSFESDREYPTDGSSSFRHPIQEAAEAERRLLSLAAPAFDEFIVLKFVATNESPYKFKWVNEKAGIMDYGSILTRISQQYEKRF